MTIVYIQLTIIVVNGDYKILYFTQITKLRYTQISQSFLTGVYCSYYKQIKRLCLTWEEWELFLGCRHK